MQFFDRWKQGGSRRMQTMTSAVCLPQFLASPTTRCLTVGGSRAQMFTAQRAQVLKMTLFTFHTCSLDFQQFCGIRKRLSCRSRQEMTDPTFPQRKCFIWTSVVGWTTGTGEWDKNPNIKNVWTHCSSRKKRDAALLIMSSISALLNLHISTQCVMLQDQ